MASAGGFFTHVYLDRATGKPAPLSDDMRAALKRLIV
jgi:acyl-CoA thioester hydrolase